MSGESVTKHLDEVVDDFARTVPFFYEPLTRGRAITFVEQHRLNTRQRNTVLKLRVATNCPDWEVRTSILKGCTQEAIADSEYGGGKAHWEILQELGTYIDLELSEIQTAEPLKSTRLCWLAWVSHEQHTLARRTDSKHLCRARECSWLRPRFGSGKRLVRYGKRTLEATLFPNRRTT